MFLQYSGVSAILFHRCDGFIEIGDDFFVIGVFTAYPDIHATNCQRFLEYLQFCHAGRYEPIDLVTQHAFIVQGKVDLVFNQLLQVSK